LAKVGVEGSNSFARSRTIGIGRSIFFETSKRKRSRRNEQNTVNVNAHRGLKTLKTQLQREN
jgi:hypothetical protein